MNHVKRRFFLKQITKTASVAVASTVFPSAMISGCFTKRESSPNIILILTDDQGYGDIGVHGNDKIKTTNMDRLASESVELPPKAWNSRNF